MAAIREGLAANLSTLPDTQVSAYMLANPTLPTVWVSRPESTDYDMAMGRGHDDETVVVQAIAGSPFDIAAQVNLDRYCAPEGAYSIKEAIESDPTLGGAVEDLRVTSRGGYRTAQIPGVESPCLVCEWNVTVINPGT